MPFVRKFREGEEERTVPEPRTSRDNTSERRTGSGRGSGRGSGGGGERENEGIERKRDNDDDDDDDDDDEEVRMVNEIKAKAKKGRDTHERLQKVEKEERCQPPPPSHAPSTLINLLLHVVGRSMMEGEESRHGYIVPGPLHSLAAASEVKSVFGYCFFFLFF